MQSGYSVAGTGVGFASIASLQMGVGIDRLLLALLVAVAILSYVVAAKSATSALGEATRGWLVGLNAAGNLVLATTVYTAVFGVTGGRAIGISLAALNAFAAFRIISQSRVYQAVLGWANWLMPMSWLVTGIGAILYLLNVVGHIVAGLAGIKFFRIAAFGAHWATGTYFVKGGWISNLNPIDTAFNMGNFSFVDRASGAWHKSHESGHTLNLGAFGAIFHLAGALDENVTGGGANAFSERLAESHASGEAGNNIPMWL